MKVGRWQITRARPPGVTGHEIWELPGSDIEFWRRAGTTYVHRRRAEGVKEAEIGREVASEVALVLGRLQRGEYSRALALKGFTRAFICGGLTVLDGFRESLSALKPPFSLQFGEGSLGAVMGGRAWLAENGFDSGAVFDVGQSALKIDLFAPQGEEVRIVARDLQRAPIIFEAERMKLGEARLAEIGAASLEFVADVLAESLESRFLPPPRAVLSLPCPLSDDLVPGGSTYTHWANDATLVSRLVQALDARLQSRARLAQCHWRTAPEIRLWVINDAEMAAVGARRQAGGGGKMLVLTLGYGPGAALVEG